MGQLEILEEDLKAASEILEWEMGDIWGHIGARMPSTEGITLKMFRRPEEEGVEDWVIRFDYSMKKISGVGRPPTEAAIYTELLKARSDINAVMHSHAPMCIALSLADKKIEAIHMQSGDFVGGIPIYPEPIFIIDEKEGADLARAIGKKIAIVIKGHGIVAVGKSVDEVFTTALYLERTAKIQAMACALGFQGPTAQFEKYMQDSRKRHKEYLKAHRGEGRYFAEWRYYRDKLTKRKPWHRGMF